MTLLVTSILCDHAGDALRAAQRALADAADVVEIRIDTWDDDGTAFARLAAELPEWRWIVTCRPVAEGGYFRGDTQERIARLLAAGSAGRGYVDFELADWLRSANIRQKIRLAVARRETESVDRSALILSRHDLSERPADVRGVLTEIAAQVPVSAGASLSHDPAGCGTARAEARGSSGGGIVAKLVWQPEDICDNFIAFDVLRDAPVPAIALCLGETGLPSRVLARKFGAFASYCAPARGAETAPGQLTLAEMLDLYRWRRIDADTRVYGVIGDPVAHSMSPRLFNACFERYGINAVYLPLRVDAHGDVLARFLDGCLRRPWLDVGGFSVTLPHKQTAAALVKDRLDPPAGRIGAVNTLIAGPGGFSGRNTDCDAALDAITETMNCTRDDLAGLRADVLGAGGIARAVVAGLRQHGCEVTVCNRDATRGQALADEFGGCVQSWDRRAEPTGADLLINCTRLGMWPDGEQSPMPPERFAGEAARPVVFDTVYNPVRTRLLREAAAAGCRTIDGLTLFLNQAAAQWTCWTGRPPDKDFMRSIVEPWLAPPPTTSS